jgi:hypothetical protein
VHTLDKTLWTDIAGNVLDPAAGDMSLLHLENTINFIQKPYVVRRLKSVDKWYYRILPTKHYVRFRVRRSNIWKALHKGLDYYNKLCTFNGKNEG